MSKLNSRLAIATCSILAIIGIVQSTNSDLRTSQQGMELIGNAEGCRRNPYLCPADVLTVGIGSTAASSGAINKNKTYSDEEIAKRFATDLRNAENCVNQYANGKNMPQGAFDAMVSITFNLGCPTMKKSTLYRMATRNQHPEMCYQFMRWVYSNGKILKGLQERRKKERDFCLGLINYD